MSGRMDWGRADAALAALDKTIERIQSDARMRSEWAGMMNDPRYSEAAEVAEPPEPRARPDVWQRRRWLGPTLGLMAMAGSALLVLSVGLALWQLLLTVEEQRAVLRGAAAVGTMLLGLAAIVDALVYMERRR